MTPRAVGCAKRALVCRRDGTASLARAHADIAIQNGAHGGSSAEKIREGSGRLSAPYDPFAAAGSAYRLR